jgi:opacity protein-like surface antigen
MNFKIALTSTAVLTALLISATVQAATPYIEGQVGVTNLEDTDTKPHSGSNGGITFNNTNLNLDYDSSTTFGFELGAKDVIPNVRIGASISRMNFDLKSATVNGSFTDGSTDSTTTITGPSSVSGNDLVAAGLNLDKSVNLYMVNAYYDFKNSTEFTPFLGFGIGLADIENTKDNEFAYAINAGAKYNIGKQTYIGVKATYTTINGPKDERGFSFKDIKACTANVSIGYEF